MRGDVGIGLCAYVIMQCHGARMVAEHVSSLLLRKSDVRLVVTWERAYVARKGAARGTWFERGDNRKRQRQPEWDLVEFGRVS